MQITWTHTHTHPASAPCTHYPTGTEDLGIGPDFSRPCSPPICVIFLIWLEREWEEKERAGCQRFTKVAKMSFCPSFLLTSLSKWDLSVYLIFTGYLCGVCHQKITHEIYIIYRSENSLYMLNTQSFFFPICIHNHNEKSAFCVMIICDGVIFTNIADL